MFVAVPEERTVRPRKRAPCSVGLPNAFHRPSGLEPRGDLLQVDNERWVRVRLRGNDLLRCLSSRRHFAFTGVIGFAPQKVARPEKFFLPRALEHQDSERMAPDDAAWRCSSCAVFFWRALSLFDASWRRLAPCGASSGKCAIERQRVSPKRQLATVDDK